jgi:glycosyltransferase involved in cell wall biosynthesis
MKYPLKILFVNPFADVSGPETVILRLMRGLDKERFAPTLLCPEEGRLAKAARALGIDVHIISLEINFFTANPLRLGYQAYDLAKTVLRLISIIKRGRYDLVHINSHRIGLACTLAARLSGVPIIWHIHEIYQTTPLRRRIIVELARHLPDALVAVSDAVAAQFVPCSKLHCIYNGIDAVAYAAQADREAVRREFHFGPSTIVIGCMGRLTPQKGQDIFLQAASLVAAVHPETRFLVVGDEALGETGFKAYLEALACRLGLNGRVFFVGYRSDAASVMAAMDLFVHAAVIPESLPMVILEAMALGKPVVATATGGIPELIKDGQTGLLVPAGDASALAQSIHRLLANPDLAQQLGEAGRCRVEEQFSWKNHVQQFEDLYQRLIAGRRVVR